MIMKTAFNKVVMRNKQTGVSMLEVLIALLITTVGLLGFASLQSRALVSTEDTYQRTQATSLAQEIIERMRMSGISPGTQSNANAAAADYTTASNWSGSLPADLDECLGITAACSASEMAKYDIAQIRDAVENSGNLPNGRVLVQACDNDRVCAYIAWGEDDVEECAAADGVGFKTCVVIQGA